MLQLPMKKFDGPYYVWWLAILATPVDLRLVYFLLCSQTPQMTAAKYQLGPDKLSYSIWFGFSKVRLCTMFKTQIITV